MRNEILPTPPELVQMAKQNWNEEFSSEAECFVNAFSNGEYHEEDFDWGGIGDALTKDQLVSLFLPVCHALIRGSVDHREGASLDAIMQLYSQLIKWQKNHLKEPADILVSLDTVRPYVLALVADTPAWSEAKYFYQTLDYGIRRRMGLATHPLDSAYRR